MFRNTSLSPVSSRPVPVVDKILIDLIKIMQNVFFLCSGGIELIVISCQICMKSIYNTLLQTPQK